MFHVPPKRHHIMRASTSIGGRRARRRQQRGDATKPAVAKSGIQSAYDYADEDEDHDRNPAAKPAVAKSAVNSSGDFAVVDQDHDRKPAAKPAVAKGGGSPDLVDLTGDDSDGGSLPSNARKRKSTGITHCEAEDRKMPPPRDADDPEDDGEHLPGGLQQSGTASRTPAASAHVPAAATPAVDVAKMHHFVVSPRAPPPSQFTTAAPPPTNVLRPPEGTSP